MLSTVLSVDMVPSVWYRSLVSRWWLQDCRSEAYALQEGDDGEEQVRATDHDSAQAPGFDAAPPQVS